MAGYLAELTVR